MRQVPEKQLGRRRRAVAALGDHTATVLDQLRDAEDELLAGEQPGHNVVYCYCTATVLPVRVLCTAAVSCAAVVELAVLAA